MYVSDMGVAARSVSEEFSSGCEGRSGSGGGSTGAPADQDHRPDHKQHRDRTPDDRDEGSYELKLMTDRTISQNNMILKLIQLNEPIPSQ